MSTHSQAVLARPQRRERLNHDQNMQSEHEVREVARRESPLKFNLQLRHQVKKRARDESSPMSTHSQPVLSRPQSREKLNHGQNMQSDHEVQEVAVSEFSLLSERSRPCTNASSSSMESQKPPRPGRLQSRERTQQPNQVLKQANITPQQQVNEVARNEMMRKRAVQRVASEQRLRKQVEQEGLEARMLNYINRENNSVPRKNSARRTQSENDKKSLVEAIDEYRGTMASHSLNQWSETTKSSCKLLLHKRPPFMAGANNRDRPPQPYRPPNTNHPGAFQLPRIPQVSKSAGQAVEQALRKGRSCDITRLPHLVSV